jgi:hypothetical protein
LITIDKGTERATRAEIRGLKVSERQELRGDSLSQGILKRPIGKGKLG